MSPSTALWQGASFFRHWSRSSLRPRVFGDPRGFLRLDVRANCQAGGGVAADSLDFYCLISKWLYARP